jgi:hypothetical protein
MKHKEFTTRTELKSLTQSIKCAETECGSLRMLSECLGWLLHAPRGPFYSPKAARSHWRPKRKAILAFCRVAHRTVRCAPARRGRHRTVTIDGPVPISFLLWRRRSLQIHGSWSTGHSPMPRANRWRGPRVAHGLRDRPLRW